MEVCNDASANRFHSRRDYLRHPKKRARRFSNPFSIEPFKNVSKFEESPFLDVNTSRNVLGTMVGVFLAMGPFLFEVSRSKYAGAIPDSWTRMVCVSGISYGYVFAWISLLVLTFLIFLKQYGYYYGIHDNVQPTGKQKFFINSIRQVNELENSLDVTLAVVGATLFPLVFFPVFWFLAFGIYAVLVALRSLITLLRRTFANVLKAKKEPVLVPQLYSVLRETTDDGKFEVKFVLGGWIITMTAVALCSFISFIVLFGLFDYLEVNFILLPISFLVLIITVGLLFGVLGMYTYDWAQSEWLRSIFRQLENEILRGRVSRASI